MALVMRVRRPPLFALVLDKPAFLEAAQSHVKLDLPTE
jgi:hypothetical protein